MWSVINHFNEFMSQVKQNPLLAAIVAMWGATVVGFLLRSAPKAIWQWAWRHGTINITIDSDVGRYYATGRITESFAQALNWVASNSIGRLTRELRVHSTKHADGVEVPVVGIGDGTHYVLWKGRFFIVEKGVKGEDKGIERLQYIRITMIGWSHKRLIEFIEASVTRETNTSKIARIYQLSGSNWERQYGVTARNLDNVFIEENIKNGIKHSIEDFLGSRDWYNKRHLAYKQSYLFYGEPGTGKTSLIRAIGHQYTLDMYIVDLSAVSLTTLAAALNEVRCNNANKPVIMVFEDIETSGVVDSRKQQHAVKELVSVEDDNDSHNDMPKSGAPDEQSVDLKSFLREANIGTLLNILDGIVPLDNVIFMSTTNHIEKIDPAILRPGRTDYKIEIPFLHDKEIKAYLSYMYDTNFTYDATFMPIAGCQLELLFKQHKHSINNLVKELKTWENHKCQTNLLVKN